MKQFIEGLPKVELHCHIEGTFEPELLFEIANRNKIKLTYPSVEALRKAYDFSELQDFLDIYYQGMNVLQTEQDFFDLTWAYLQRISQQNVRHTEIFFDPQGHTHRGIAFETVVNGISRALDQGHRELNVSYKLIMCFLRHLDEADALQTLEMAKPFKDKIIGVGLDSSEMGHPPSKFRQVFAAAKKQGYLAVAHAGEEGPPQYIEEALDILKIDRVDHGNSCMQSKEMIGRLVSEELALTVCPLSNTRLCVVDKMENHPLKQMLDAGLKVTINSDDPAYFGGYMNENFLAVTDALQLEKTDLVRLAQNAIDASFADVTRKQILTDELQHYVQASE